MQLVVKLDWYAARLDDRAQFPAYVHQVGIDVAVSLALPRPRDRPTAQNGSGVPVKDKAAAEPFRLTIAQPQAMRHAGAREPVISHQAHLVWFIDGIGATMGRKRSLAEEALHKSEERWRAVLKIRPSALLSQT